ncbi:unnamed protein product [Owenia fusiformis]|uniref:Uncharacterized protein n=1 Tax=Owenia fusiformis TaxID=6347 RepID=A0A8S4PG62_OWEFU|nr:unnamed protein product [Owenia fusiformis]
MTSENRDGDKQQPCFNPEVLEYHGEESPTTQTTDITDTSLTDTRPEPSVFQIYPIDVSTAIATDTNPTRDDSDEPASLSVNSVSDPKEDLNDLLKEPKAKDDRRQEKENKVREDEDKLRKDADERRAKEDDILTTSQKNIHTTAQKFISYNIEVESQEVECQTDARDFGTELDKRDPSFSVTPCNYFHSDIGTRIKEVEVDKSGSTKNEAKNNQCSKPVERFRKPLTETVDLIESKIEQSMQDVNEEKQATNETTERKEVLITGDTEVRKDQTEDQILQHIEADILMRNGTEERSRDITFDIDEQYENKLKTVLSKLKHEEDIRRDEEDERREEERMRREDEDKIRQNEDETHNQRMSNERNWGFSCCFRKALHISLQDANDLAMKKRRKNENKIREEEDIRRKEEDERRAAYDAVQAKFGTEGSLKDLGKKLHHEEFSRRATEDKRRNDEDQRRENELQMRSTDILNQRCPSCSASVCFCKTETRDSNITAMREREDKRREEDTRRNIEDKRRVAYDRLFEDIPDLTELQHIRNKTDNQIKIERLKSEEQKFTEELKTIRMINKLHKNHKKQSPNDKKEWRESTPKHVKLLWKIGNIHREIGRLEGDQFEYIKAIGIYECAIVHCHLVNEELNTTDTISEDISETLVHLEKGRRKALDLFFQHCTGKGTPNQYFKDEEENKEELKAIRKELKYKIQSMDKESFWFEPNLRPEERKIREESQIRENGKIFEWIQGKMKTFVSRLVTQCKKILDFCKNDFAFLAFGSLSRKETTPYSDVEFAAVQDSNDSEMNPDYKMRLTNVIMTLHLKFLSFGETILPAMYIRSLNGPYSSEDWYFDQRKYVVTKQGISFDGLMPWANKTPYFTIELKNGKKFCLTNTKRAFMQFFWDNDNAKIVKKLLFFFKGDFTTIFGDKQIEADMRKCFMKSPQREQVMKMIVDELEDDFEKHSNVKKIYYAKYKRKLIEKDEIHVKKELYRLPSVVINNLLHLIGNNITCAWDITENNSKIHSDVIHNLKMMLSTSAEIRLRCYSNENGQVDVEKGELLPDIFVGTDVNKDVFGKSLILRYFLSAIPFVLAMEEAKDRKSNPRTADKKAKQGHVARTIIRKENPRAGNMGDAERKARDIDTLQYRAVPGHEEDNKPGEYILRSLKSATLYDPSHLNKAMAYILMNDKRKAEEEMNKANECKTYDTSPTQQIMYILCNTFIDNDSISKPFFDKWKDKALVNEEMDIDVKNALGNTLRQKGNVMEETEVLETSVDDSLKDRRKITSVTLLNYAYEQANNETKLQELHDKYPEIKEIQNMRNELKTLEDENAKHKAKVEKITEQNRQYEKEIKELRRKRACDSRKKYKWTYGVQENMSTCCSKIDKITIAKLHRERERERERER